LSRRLKSPTSIASWSWSVSICYWFKKHPMPETSIQGARPAGTKILKGITWGHSRGFTPLVAAAQRFNEKHPDVSIVWEKRTLQQFADYPIERLIREYDLLIIDHPWVGTAAAQNCVL